MKKAVFLTILVALVILTFGCINSTGSFVVTSCVSNQTKNAFSMSYDSFNGYKTYSFKVNDGASLSVRFVTDSGTLSCEVRDANGNEYYRNDNVLSGSLTIPLGDSGKYYVTLTADHHTGAFYFDIV